MTLTLLIEVLILLGVGAVSITEGTRLVMNARPGLYDIIGPGYYNIGMGAILALVGILYLFTELRRGEKTEVIAGSAEYKLKMIMIIAAMIFYIIMMSLFGYFISSVLFFVVILRVVGFRSWLTSIPIGLVMAASFYLVFVKWLNMIFPTGTWIQFG